jgi:hypothetical protein
VPYTNITATLTNGSSVTINYGGTGDDADVSYYVSNIVKNSGGVWVNNIFYPITSIQYIQVS